MVRTNFFTQTLINDQNEIRAGIKINKISPLKIFWHQFVIDKLQESNNLFKDEKKNIKNGFCYTLALDWLFRKNMAEFYYLPPLLRDGEELVLWNTNNNEIYYVPLARNFSNYIKYTLCFEKQTIRLSGVYGSQYSDFAPQQLFQIDTFFASMYRIHPFSSGSLLLSSEDIIEFININNNINKALFRLIMHHNKEIVRHTVAMQNFTTSNGQQVYHFFDPNFGVYEIQKINTGKIYSPLDFFDKLLGKYKLKNRIFLGGYVSYEPVKKSL